MTIFYLHHQKRLHSLRKGDYHEHSTAQHSTAQHRLGEYTQVEKLDLTSKDVLSDNIAKIGQLFPEVLTESSDENGRLRPAIDFDKLRQFLSREIVEGRESYEFTWVGKRGAIAEAGKPTSQTLRPDLEESVDFDKSENIFITGDNLEVLKVLQESYLGKIDMIYIDPPYNTGKDFVYRDRSQLSEKELEELSKQRNENDELLFKFETNAKQSAKYHSDWLNMMYPRLVLARNLLKDSGVIFISIDDNEQANLKAICDEIFGEENFVGENIVVTNPGGRKYGSFSRSFDYLLVYSKSNIHLITNEVENEDAKFNYYDEKGGYNYHELLNRNIKVFHSGTRPNLRYPFYVDLNTPDQNGFYKVYLEENNGLTEVWGRETQGYKGVWTWGKEKSRDNLDELFATVNKIDGSIRIQRKLRKLTGIPNSIFPSTPEIVKAKNAAKYSSFAASQKLQELFDGKNFFDFPKPIALIEKLLQIGSSSDSLILDFFAGSATTAHAVMQLNAEDGGNRKYILCTLDEQVADKSAAKEAGYETIDQISRERIRRAAKKIQEEHPERVGKQDFGFRAYKLDTSNFKDISQTPDSFTQEDLFDSVCNIKDGRTDLDLLLQIMLTWGMELSLPIAKTQIDGTDVYNVADGALIACFADEISERVLRQIAKEEPLRAVFKDESFANSAAKINLGQIFKEEAPNTKVKVV